ncbi:MAG: hypothetical protein ACFB0G_14400 [Leptolyngbyaceae cyanobacterium]
MNFQQDKIRANLREAIAHLFPRPGDPSEQTLSSVVLWQRRVAIVARRLAVAKFWLYP